MRRLYTILRLLGYAGGLLGMVLFVLGKQGGNRELMAGGGALLLVSFSAFVLSYVAFVVIRLRSRT